MARRLGKNSERVYTYIEKGIEQGRFARGSRIPSQQELATRLSVSRSTIQKAVAAMLEDGVIYSIQGSGMFISDQLPLRADYGSLHGRKVVDSNVIAMMVIRTELNLQRLQDLALRENHLMCYYFQQQHEWTPGQERKFLEQIKRNRHKALVAFMTPKSKDHFNDSLLTGLDQQGIRIIHVDPYQLNAMPEQEFLVPNYELAGLMAATHFLLREYRTFFFAGLHTDGPYAKLFEKGYAEGISNFNCSYTHQTHYIEVDELNNSDNLRNSSLHEELMQKRKPAILARTSDLAVRLRDFLHANGFNCPQDYGLAALSMTEHQKNCIKIDNLSFSRQHIYEEIVRSILSPDPVPLRKLVSPRLVEHETV